jgi:hypothetical protein
MCPGPTSAFVSSGIQRVTEFSQAGRERCPASIVGESHEISLAVVVGLFYADAVVAHDPEWLPGDRRPCNDACASAGKHAVDSGKYRSPAE